MVNRNSFSIKRFLRIIFHFSFLCFFLNCYFNYLHAVSTFAVFYRVRHKTDVLYKKVREGRISNRQRYVLSIHDPFQMSSGPAQNTVRILSKFIVFDILRRVQKVSKINTKLLFLVSDFKEKLKNNPTL